MFLLIHCLRHIIDSIPYFGNRWQHSGEKFLLPHLTSIDNSKKDKIIQSSLKINNETNIATQGTVNKKSAPKESKSLTASSQRFRGNALKSSVKHVSKTAGGLSRVGRPKTASGMSSKKSTGAQLTVSWINLENCHSLLMHLITWSCCL